MLHIGIDEAGYGPLLGPLVVGAVALRLPSDAAGGRTHLRRRLRGLVVRRPRSRAALSRPLPVPVDDSKEIHRRYGLEGLARGVSIFAAGMNVSPPTDLADLLRRFSESPPETFADRPWYETLADAPMPAPPPTHRLADRFAKRGVVPLDLLVLPVSADELNEGFEQHGNKARVLGLTAGACLLAMLRRHEDAQVEVVFDRQGARLDYAAYLADLFPFAAVTKGTAPKGESHYTVELPTRRLHVRFATAADRLSLAVSWASMAAKLTRELFMDRLNAYFEARLPRLRRTAGYTADGRRFLDDVSDVLEREGIEHRTLVRSR